MPRKKCEHGRQPSQCKDCGTGRCAHGRARHQCKDCGTGYCQHSKLRHTCKKCGGISVCEHGRLRSQCIECGGSQVCEHKRQRITCKECGGKHICEHNRMRIRCWLCEPLSYARLVLARVTRNAKKLDYAVPTATPDEVCQFIRESKQCTLCFGSLDWEGKRPPDLHHNHETGLVIGFSHRRCNTTEGNGKSEQAQHFREKTYVDPDVSDVIIAGTWANGKLRGQSVK